VDRRKLSGGLARVTVASQLLASFQLRQRTTNTHEEDVKGLEDSNGV
jgi:hypothetical protein